MLQPKYDIGQLLYTINHRPEVKIGCTECEGVGSFGDLGDYYRSKCTSCEGTGFLSQFYRYPYVSITCLGEATQIRIFESYIEYICKNSPWTKDRGVLSIREGRVFDSLIKAKNLCRSKGLVLIEDKTDE